jgi:hypothetical protein
MECERRGDLSQPRLRVYWSSGVLTLDPSGHAGGTDFIVRDALVTSVMR